MRRFKSLWTIVVGGVIGLAISSLIALSTILVQQYGDMAGLVTSGFWLGVGITAFKLWWDS